MKKMVLALMAALYLFGCSKAEDNEINSAEIVRCFETIENYNIF